MQVSATVNSLIPFADSIARKAIIKLKSENVTLKSRWYLLRWVVEVSTTRDAHLQLFCNICWPLSLPHLEHVMDYSDTIQYIHLLIFTSVPVYIRWWSPYSLSFHPHIFSNFGQLRPNLGNDMYCTVPMKSFVACSALMIDDKPLCHKLYKVSRIFCLIDKEQVEILVYFCLMIPVEENQS